MGGQPPTCGMRPMMMAEIVRKVIPLKAFVSRAFGGERDLVTSIKNYAANWTGQDKREYEHPLPRQESLGAGRMPQPGIKG